VDQRQAVGGVAVAAHGRLGDAPAVHLHAGAEGAHLALEERLLHLGDELRGADHHAADGDQLIDVCGGNAALGRGRGAIAAHGNPTLNMGGQYARPDGRAAPLHRGGINDDTHTHTHTFWVQVPHVSGFQGVVGADLDLVL